MIIVATIKTGPGTPAYFADIMFENTMTLKGCPIWKTDDGSFYLGMPSVKSTQGNHYKCIELSEVLHAAATVAVLRAIQALSAVPNATAPRSGPGQTAF